MEITWSTPMATPFLTSTRRSRPFRSDITTQIWSKRLQIRTSLYVQPSEQLMQKRHPI
ncbi:unnamed protein product [Heligmosomoides polygyrus]|uniref:Uncharacterized protein n=1 Tax=Heligmosomoides polygyrus TaxID=6339 RepID=A0A3P8EZI0_HELPZ|nr:unnamed protein product [Heligmosomoides polygyrus]